MKGRVVPRYELLTFHKEFGPSSLFERIRFKFLDPPTRRLNTSVSIRRMSLPQVINLALDAFNPAEWDLVWAKVRSDTGKFTTTSWRREVQASYWWVVMGYGDFVFRVFVTKLGVDGLNSDVIESGDQYTFVEKVNRDLMEAEFENAPQVLPEPKIGFGKWIPKFFTLGRRKTPCIV